MIKQKILKIQTVWEQEEHIGKINNDNKNNDVCAKCKKGINGIKYFEGLALSRNNKSTNLQIIVTQRCIL